MTKNREETERAILDAVTRIVRDRGFDALGVNAVAEAAGVSKILIYRYFGSYRGLLERWAVGRNFWLQASADAGRALADAARTEAPRNRTAVAELLKGLIRSQSRELRTDAVSREILRWFIAEKDAAASAVMARLEERGAALTAALGALLGGKEDIAALSAVAIAGVYYLALLADRAEVFNGVDIASEAGWERLLGSLDRLIDAIVAAE